MIETMIFEQEQLDHIKARLSLLLDRIDMFVPKDDDFTNIKAARIAVEGAKEYIEIILRNPIRIHGDWRPQTNEGKCGHMWFVTGPQTIDYDPNECPECAALEDDTDEREDRAYHEASDG